MECIMNQQTNTDMTRSEPSIWSNTAIGSCDFAMQRCSMIWQVCWNGFDRNCNAPLNWNGPRISTDMWARFQPSLFPPTPLPLPGSGERRGSPAGRWSTPGENQGSPQLPRTAPVQRRNPPPPPPEWEGEGRILTHD